MRYLHIFLITFFFSINAKTQIIRFDEKFNSSSLPAGWTSNPISGTQGWIFNRMGTNSFNGSPMAFFNDDALGGASLNNTAALLSPIFDNSIDSITYLEFDYNFRSFSGITDSFLVEVFDGSAWQRVMSVGVDDCGQWRTPACSPNLPKALIDITAFKNPSCQIRFIYHDGNDWAWFAAIDNVVVTSTAANDISLVDLAHIPNSCDTNTGHSLNVSLVNKGILPQSNFSIAYQLNRNSAIFSTFSGTLNQGDTAIFTFPNQTSFNSGSNSLNIYTDLTNDDYLLNDTLKTTYFNSSVQLLPYFEDFESDPKKWKVSGQNPSWEVGQPNTTKLSSAAGGLNAAVTNLNGLYNSNELSYISSPCLQLSGISNALRISFDAWREITLGLDGVWLEYSLDGGQNWMKVLDNSGYRIQSWYNNISAQRWYGDRSNGYYHSSNIIRNIPFNAELRFRFVLSSDQFTQREGFAFDNFRVSELPRIDLSMDSLLLPSDIICRLDVFNQEFLIENLGADTIFDSEFFYEVNGFVFRDSLRNPLAPGQYTNFSFRQYFDFDSLNNVSIKLWAVTPGDTLNQNDTLLGSINNSPAAVFKAPYFETFGGDTLGGIAATNWTAPNSGPNQGWRIGSFCNSCFDADGDQTYVNYTFGNSSVNYSLVSPCIDLDSLDEPTLQFAFQNGHEFYVQIYSRGQWITIDTVTEQTIWAFNSKPTWKYHNVELNEYANRTIKFRFIGGPSVSIDDVRVFDPNTDPLKIKGIELDSVSCLVNAQQSVRLRYRELISDTINKDSLSFELYVNNNLIASENSPNDHIELGADTFYVFNQKLILNQSSPHTIKVITRLNYKGKLHLDSIEKTSQAVYDQLPYFESFENSFVNCKEKITSEVFFDQSNGWTFEPFRAIPDSNNFYLIYQGLWHVTDTSKCSYYNSATAYTRSGPAAAHEGNAFIYTDQGDSSSYLYSPCFDLSNFNQAKLEYYYHRYFLGPNYGMGNLKLEVRYNNNWTLIDRVDTSWNVPNVPWQKRSIDISAYLGSNVQLRFYVDSTPYYSTNPPNTAIDAFKIFDPLVTDVESLKTQTQTLAIYPNPNNGEFKIEVSDELINQRYEIIDLSGKVLKSTTFKSTTENIQIEADKGVYIIRVPEHGVHQKVVVY